MYTNYLIMGVLIIFAFVLYHYKIIDSITFLISLLMITVIIYFFDVYAIIILNPIYLYLFYGYDISNSTILKVFYLITMVILIIAYLINTKWKR